MQDFEQNDLSGAEDSATDRELVSAPALELDASDYEIELDAIDLTEEQKNEMLSILWSMMSGMVELGFSHDLCGQIFGGMEITSASVPEELESPSSKERLT